MYFTSRYYKTKGREVPSLAPVLSLFVHHSQMAQKAGWIQVWFILIKIFPREMKTRRNWLSGCIFNNKMLEENSVYPVFCLACRWHLCGYECPATEFSLCCSHQFMWKPSLHPLLGTRLLLIPLSFVWEGAIYPLSSPTACILGAIRYHLILNINEFGRAQISSTRDACPLLITHSRAAGSTEREGVWSTWHSQCFHQCSSNSWWTLGYTLHCSTTFHYFGFFYGQKDF